MTIFFLNLILFILVMSPRPNLRFSIIAGKKNTSPKTKSSHKHSKRASKLTFQSKEFDLAKQDADFQLTIPNQTNQGTPANAIDYTAPV